MIEIRYVGRKPWAVDNVAHTGTIWCALNDVQAVPPGAARRLLKHPDQWELANPEDEALLAVAIHTTTDKDGKQIEVDEADLKKPLEKMTRAELKVYAKTHFNREVNASQPRTVLLDLVDELERTANRVNTLVPDLDETPK
ncbi:MAG: hypothetical protein WDN30_14055 [Pararobbsia sp.]